MRMYIKSMVSRRCKLLVEKELAKLNLHTIAVGLGIVEIKEDMSREQREKFGYQLSKAGLEIIDDKKDIITERIKNVITELIYFSEDKQTRNYSEYISEKLNYDYTYLSNIFSAVKGMTIQQFIILNKIERVKELLSYQELNLTEISYRMHYSSLAHLSSQFKKVTGFTPSYFRKMKHSRVVDLENL